MPKLGINVDHVATLRQARRVGYPDPVEAALAAQRAGAEAITVHLREDRRHIQDDDLIHLRHAIKVHLNQEMAPVDEMVEIALRLRPDDVCLVPERREEITTEGGLDAAGQQARIAPVMERLLSAGIRVSIFVDPDVVQVEAAAQLGAQFVELHTGMYAQLADASMDMPSEAGRGSIFSGEVQAELDKIRTAVKAARKLGLKPNAGHGLNYHNVAAVAAMPGLAWLHIGHSVVSRAVMVGIARAVREMKQLIDQARGGHKVRVTTGARGGKAATSAHRAVRR